MIGYAFCGSFCTLQKSLDQLSALTRAGYEIQPIVSEHVYTMDTRFGKAADFVAAIERITGKRVKEAWMCLLTQNTQHLIEIG